MKRPLILDQTSIRNRRTSRARLNRMLIGRVLLGLAATGGVVLSGQATNACDYCDSVELDYAGCDGVACDGNSCDSMGGGCKLGGGKIFRALDAVAGGVEKLMGFDKCGQGNCGCDSLGCDGGCDSCSGGDMMMPMAPAQMGGSMSTHSYVAPQPAPIYSAPRMPHATTSPPMAAPPMAAPRMAAPRMAAPRAVAPSTQYRMSEPMIVSPQAPQHEAMMPPSDPMELESMDAGLETETRTAPRVTAPRATTPRTTTPRTTTPRATTPRATTPRATTPRTTAPRVPADRMTAPRTPKPRDISPVDRLPSTAPEPTPIPDPVPATPPKQDGGSLFDTLDDPFGDDVRFSPRQPVQMRPTNYRKTQLSQPIRLHAPQASNKNSTRPHVQKAASQHRVARGSHSFPSRSASNGHVTTPLRTGSSFRNLNNSASPQRRTTRQVSHNHQAGKYSSSTIRRTTPQLAPAPVPRRSTARPHANSVQNRGVQHTSRTHVHHVPIAQPRSGQTTGQRHSTAGYSGYGHTTNR